MSLHNLATVINESHEPIKLSFEKVDFIFGTTPTEILVTSVNAKGKETESVVKQDSSPMKLALVISELTRVEYPEHDVSALANPVMVLRVIQDVISNGTEYTDDAFSDLITRLKKHDKPVVIVDGQYVTTIQFANEQVTVQIRREGMYCNTVHFGYAGSVKNVIDWIVVEYQQINGAVPPNEQQLAKTLHEI